MYVRGSPFLSRNLCAAENGFSVGVVNGNCQKYFTRESTHHSHYTVVSEVALRLECQRRKRSRIPSHREVVSALNQRRLQRRQLLTS